MLIVVLAYAIFSFIVCNIFYGFSFGYTFLVLLSCLILYRITTVFFSLTNIQSYLLFNDLISDEFSFWLTLICLIVILLSLMVGLHDYKYSLDKGLLFSVVSILLISSIVFSTSNFFVLYLFYEFSLLPIIYIIIKWGSYPDRFASSVMILVYTTVVSFPLIVLVLLVRDYSTILAVTGFNFYCPLYFLLIIFFAFSAKLPLYGVHYWLPIAHVEAPTFGSIILAGVLLKLGGIGLVRFSMVLSFQQLNLFILGYVLVALVLSSIITSFQSDFKRLVAYSSVVHMRILVVSIISGVRISYTAVLIIMVLHGLVSPFMFMIVGFIYKIFSSRLLSLLQGALMLSYIAVFILVMIFVINVPTPPFSSFISEVLVFLGLVNYRGFSILIVGLYVFLSIVFNVYWLRSITFGSYVCVVPSVSVSFAEFAVGLYTVLFMIFRVFLLGLFYAYSFFSFGFSCIIIIFVKNS